MIVVPYSINFNHSLTILLIHSLICYILTALIVSQVKSSPVPSNSKYVQRRIDDTFTNLTDSSSEQRTHVIHRYHTSLASCFPICSNDESDDDEDTSLQNQKGHSIGFINQPEKNWENCQNLVNDSNRMKLVQVYVTLPVYLRCQLEPKRLPKLKVLHVHLRKSWDEYQTSSINIEKIAINSHINEQSQFNFDTKNETRLIELFLSSPSSSHDQLMKPITEKTHEKYKENPLQNEKKSLNSDRECLSLNLFGSLFRPRRFHKYLQELLVIDPTKTTMFHHASKNNFTKIISIYFDQFTKRNFKNFINGQDTLDKRTPLMLASIKGYTEIVQQLIAKNVGLDLQDKSGYSALMLAAQNGQERAAVQLVQAGADLGLQDSKYITDVFTIAIHLKQITLIRALSFAMGQFDQFMWNYGGKMLALGCQNGDIKIVKNLVGNRILSYDDSALWVNSCLIVAAERGFDIIIKYLIDVGVSMDEIYYNAQETPLIVASRTGNLGLVKLLDKAGVDLNRKCTSRKYTALMIAAQNGRFNIVRYLVKRGADINAKDHANHTAMAHAIQKGHRQIANYLFFKGTIDDILDQVTLPYPETE